MNKTNLHIPFTYRLKTKKYAKYLRVISFFLEIFLPYSMVNSLFILRDAIEFYPDFSVTKNQ